MPVARHRSAWAALGRVAWGNPRSSLHPVAEETVAGFAQRGEADAGLNILANLQTHIGSDYITNMQCREVKCINQFKQLMELAGRNAHKI